MSPEGTVKRVGKLTELVRSFPPGSGSGPSGLSPAHLQEAVACGDDEASRRLLGALDAFVMVCEDGGLPEAAAQHLASANLIPLRKGDDGVRPVAVGECLRRLVGKRLMSEGTTLEAARSLLPLQTGVRVQDACLLTSLSLQQAVDRWRPGEGWVLVQVDLTNAFNSIDRQKVLEAVKARAPHLLPFALSCYGRHSSLYCRGEVIGSQQGVQQGDPLGPLLFALAWQEVAEASSEGLEWCSWYLDDGHLLARDPQVAATSLDTVVQKWHVLGVEAK